MLTSMQIIQAPHTHERIHHKPCTTHTHTMNTPHTQYTRARTGDRANGRTVGQSGGRTGGRSEGRTSGRSKAPFQKTSESISLPLPFFCGSQEIGTQNLRVCKLVSAHVRTSAGSDWSEDVITRPSTQDQPHVSFAYVEGSFTMLFSKCSRHMKLPCRKHVVSTLANHNIGESAGY